MVGQITVAEIIRLRKSIERRSVERGILETFGRLFRRGQETSAEHVSPRRTEYRLSMEARLLAGFLFFRPSETPVRLLRKQGL